MRKLKLWSLALLFTAGTILVLNSGTGITGAVIGVNINPSLSLLMGISLIVIALFLAASKQLDRLAQEGVESLESFTEKVRADNPDVVILDTSAIIPYTDDLDALASAYESLPNVLIRPSVMAELKNNKVRKKLRAFVDSSEVPAKYQTMARKYLDKVSKSEYQKKIVPIILGKEPAPKSRIEAAPLIEKTKKVMKWLTQDGKSLTKNNLLNTINTHCKVSDTDVDALATVLYQASQGKNVSLEEKDRDFEEAIDMIKAENLGLKGNIIYKNPSRY